MTSLTIKQLLAEHALRAGRALGTFALPNLLVAFGQHRKIKRRPGLDPGPLRLQRPLQAKLGARTITALRQGPS